MKFNLIIILILLHISLYSQDSLNLPNNYKKSFEIELNTGVSFIDFRILQNYDQKAIASSSEIPLKLVDDYKTRLNYGFSLGVNTIPKQGKYNTIAFNYNFYSTGSRLAYSDYSGELNLDNIYTLVEYGISFSPNFPIKNSNLSFRPILQAGMLNTTITSKSYQRVYTIDSTISTSFSKTSYFGEFGLKLNYSLDKYMFAIKASYLREFGEIYFNDGSKFRASSLKIGIYAGVNL